MSYSLHNYIWIDYVLFFYFYSVFGWMLESVYCSVLDRKLTNRGFLLGPLCPIYGTGAVSMLVGLGWIRPLIESHIKGVPGYIVAFVLVALIGAIVCDIVEYITSFLMEHLFHARWWDYSNRKFNLHGRICLHHSVFWAIGAVFFIYILDPIVGGFLLPLIGGGFKVKFYISIVLTSILAVDLIHSIISAISIRKIIDKLKQFSENVKKLPDTVSEGWKDLGDRFTTWRKDIPDRFSSLVGGRDKPIKQDRLLKNYANFSERAKQLFSDAERKLDEIKHHFDDDEML
ncbi:MAG: putative ABC transporter permease [Clostridia bacterium]|nr:putative ABC transporter permease [Clostridia bacterium]